MEGGEKEKNFEVLDGISSTFLLFIDTCRMEAIKVRTKRVAHAINTHTHHTHKTHTLSLLPEKRDYADLFYIMDNDFPRLDQDALLLLRELGSIFRTKAMRWTGRGPEEESGRRRKSLYRRLTTLLFVKQRTTETFALAHDAVLCRRSTTAPPKVAHASGTLPAALRRCHLPVCRRCHVGAVFVSTRPDRHRKPFSPLKTIDHVLGVLFKIDCCIFGYYFF